MFKKTFFTLILFSSLSLSAKRSTTNPESPKTWFTLSERDSFIAMLLATIGM